MPELPEVETVRAWLAPRLAGARVERFVLRRADLRWPMPGPALATLAGARLGWIRRRGKVLLLGVEGGGAVAALLVHLGMSGRLTWDDAPAVWDAPYGKHEHWRALLHGADGPAALRYVDARRFGVLDVVGPSLRHRLLDELGREPLEPGFDGDWLHHASRGLRSSIKALLMDNHRVVGVGNIYASEACFRAGVDPLAPAGALTAGQATALALAVQAVLHEAIADGGTTLRDFVRGDNNPGYFQQRLAVYGRAGQPCVRCGEGRRVELERSGGRATYRCPGCQTQPGRGAGVASGR